MAHRVSIRVVVTLAALLIVGCSAVPEESSATPGDFSSGVYGLAKERGASEEQLAVLAKTHGQVVFVDYQQALGLTFKCLRDAGITVIGDTVTNARGYPEIQYSWSASSPGRTEEETKVVGDRCINTNSFGIEVAYQNSTANQEAFEKQFDPYRSALIACLRKNGATVKDAADRGSLVIASRSTYSASGIDCLKQVGAPND